MFKIMHNGVYRVCLVACGCSQVPDVNFSKNYSPVVNKITFHTLLLMIIHFEFLAKISMWKPLFGMLISRKKSTCIIPKVCWTQIKMTALIVMLFLHQIFGLKTFQVLKEVTYNCRQILSVDSVEAGTYEKVNWQLGELFSVCSSSLRNGE